jgi:indole-3-glycerol phosphate synthase
MHPVIEGILKASRERGPRPAALQPGEGRNLIGSAKSLRAQGILPIIAEIKPRVLGRPLLPEEVACYARAYESCGACAISVLTEPTHFLGSIDNLQRAREASQLPVLRKDFIFNERQLEEAKADLVLLIAALGIDLKIMVQKSRSLGMEPLVEVHTPEELEQALQSRARIIGINNRNLMTLEVDLCTFERLMPVARESGVFLVAESGIHSREDALRMARAGADALLVGTALMERPEMLAELNGLKDV